MHTPADDQPADESPRDEGIPLSEPDANAWIGELLGGEFQLELTPNFGGGLFQSEIHNFLPDPDPYCSGATLYPTSSNSSSVTAQFRSDTDTLRQSSYSFVSNDSTIVGVRTIKKSHKGKASMKWWQKFLFVPWSSSRRKTAPTIDLTSNPAFSPSVGPPILYGSYQICLAAIGGGGIGKSYIFERFLTGGISCHGQYDPTIIDTVTTYRELATTNKPGVHGVTLHLTDVSGQTEYQALRALDCYPLQHLVMICFSIDSYRSLEFAKHQCFEEFSFNNYNNIPYILVGCQSDKRGFCEEVSPAEAQWAALEIGAVAYFECSAKTGQGVEELFQKSCEIVLNWAWEASDVKPNSMAGSSRYYSLGDKGGGRPGMNCVLM